MERLREELQKKYDEAIIKLEQYCYGLFREAIASS